MGLIKQASGPRGYGGLCGSGVFAGRDLAFDSLWYKGHLVTSYCRERLEYFLKHISLSGITGTPTIARTIVDERVTQIGEQAVKALIHSPMGSSQLTLKKMLKPRRCKRSMENGIRQRPFGITLSQRHYERPELNLTGQYLSLALEGKADVQLPE